MAVGFPTKVDYATGDVLSADNMNDLSGTVNLLQSAQYAAGKNAIINGDFGIWQRGTTFTNIGTGTYTADRWNVLSSNTTIDVNRSTFTPGTAPVAGYERQFFATVTSEATDTDSRLQQYIEDVRTFAGQTITISFWAKSNATTDALRWIRTQQNFGSGGSAVVNTDSAAITLTSSWARYSVTIAVPSITGKTIGTNSFLNISFGLKASTAQTLDLWGVQVEAGSTASPFQTATGTKQGELAACQRYYSRQNIGNTGSFTLGQAYSTTNALGYFLFPVQMRTTPSALEQTGTATNYGLSTSNLTFNDCTAVPIFNNATVIGSTIVFVATGLTAGNATHLVSKNNSAYLAWSAEL